MQNIMKKIKYIIASLVLCLSASIAGVLTLDNISVSAEKQSINTTYALQEVTNGLFGEKEISQSGYLYNLDGVADSFAFYCVEELIESITETSAWYAYIDIIEPIE